MDNYVTSKHSEMLPSGCTTVLVGYKIKLCNMFKFFQITFWEKKKTAHTIILKVHHLKQRDLPEE